MYEVVGERRIKATASGSTEGVKIKRVTTVLLLKQIKNIAQIERAPKGLESILMYNAAAKDESKHRTRKK